MPTDNAIRVVQPMSREQVDSVLVEISKFDYERPGDWWAYFKHYRTFARVMNGMFGLYGPLFIQFIFVLVKLGRAMGGARMLDYLDYWSAPRPDTSFLNDTSREDRTVYDEQGRPVAAGGGEFETYRRRTQQHVTAWVGKLIVDNPPTAENLKLWAELLGHCIKLLGSTPAAVALFNVQTGDFNEEGEATVTNLLATPCTLENMPAYVIVKNGGIVRNLTDEETELALTGAAARDELIERIRKDAKDESLRIRRFTWLDYAKLYPVGAFE